MKVRRVLIILIFLILFLECQSKKNTAVPEILIGVWKTSVPQYADRFFELKKDEVIFGTGEGKFDICTITNIEIEKVHEGKGSLYTIYYRNPEREEYKFSFYYDPANNGLIRFKNQEQVVWTKEKS